MKRSLFVLVIMLSFAGSSVFAQRGGRGRGRGAPQPPETAKEAAPFDMTGYWVSVVTEDWKWRMFPKKGDYAGIPLNEEGRKIADAWDPAKDRMPGNQCKAYGAPALMRNPGRFHITWQDDQTLKVEADAGTQTRMWSFDTPKGQGGDLQGVSKAEWEFDPVQGGFSFGGGGGGGANRTGSLKVVTTKLKPGYLRGNGVPYSANTVLTEYYDLVKEDNGDTYLVLTQTVEDPTYLTGPMYNAAHFKKQADATGWNPSACMTK